PQPGWYAISANFLQGRPHVIRDSEGHRTAVGLGEFSYFQFFEPVTTLGYSIYVYRISQQDVARYAEALQQAQRMNVSSLRRAQTIRAFPAILATITTPG